MLTINNGTIHTRIQIRINNIMLDGCRWRHAAAVFDAAGYAMLPYAA